MEQGVFREILIMSRNNIAMPALEGMKREFAVNQAKMCGKGKHRITGKQYTQLWQRQSFLLKEIERRERE